VVFPGVVNDVSQAEFCQKIRFVTKFEKHVIRRLLRPMALVGSPAMTIQVSITPNGRMSLPADIRKRLGVAGGGALLVEETPDGVILRTVAQSIAHAQAIARKYSAGNPDMSVDTFIANRKAVSGE
jgi:AbrB family looped-hinge helix DNA binding protein